MLTGDSLTCHYLDMNLIFDTPVRFYRFPGFIIHSVFGRKLRQFSCALNRNNCNGCPLIRHCAYSGFFETPLPENCDCLKGRNRAPHPWTVRVNTVRENEPVKELAVRFVLLGDAVRSAHIVFLAMQEAGKDGIFSARIPFTVDHLKLNGLNLPGEKEPGNDFIEAGEIWSAGEHMLNQENCRVRVNMVTPLRLKISGRYRDRFSAYQVFQAAYDRLEMLCRLYGSCGSDGEKIARPVGDMDFKVTGHELTWVDYQRYSGRQKQSMLLGGVTGFMEISGSMPDFYINLLLGAEKTGLGKGTSFGLGRIVCDVTGIKKAKNKGEAYEI